MDDIIKIGLSALAGGVVGGGALAKFGLGALRDALRQEFATRDDCNAIGSRVNALETVTIQARDAADEAQEGVRELRQEHRHLSERMAERLQDTADKLDRCVSRLEKMTSTMIRLEERINAGRPGPTTS